MQVLSRTLRVFTALIIAAFSTNMVPATAVYASNNNDNVTICHRSSSASNPYQQITVDESAVNGQGNGDHYAEHTGPVFDAATMTNGSNWGDIIPPIGNQPGLNWTSVGQQIYNNDCSLVSVTPTTPTKSDACETANDTYTIPAKTGVVYTVGGVTKPAGTYPSGGAASVTVIAKPAPGYKLSGTISWVLTFNTTTKCPVDVPMKPEVVDPCGLNNATWIVPTDTDKIDWVLTGGVLTANAKAGYTFVGGQTSINFGTAVDSGVLCVVEVPETPEYSDVCGLNNAEWIVPSDSEQITWAVVNGELIATATANYVFANESKTYNYGVAPDSGELCYVTPEAPEWVDYCGTRYDDFWLPEQKGVEYNTTWNDDGSVTVTATPANENYAFTEGAVTEWLIEFTDENCVTITKAPIAVTDTDKSGSVTVGDVMNWTITVTNNGQNYWENFYVQVTDDGTVLENDGLIESLAPGETVILNATKAVSASELAACMVTNTATYEAWYNRYNETVSRTSLDQIIIEDEYEADFTGTSTATYTMTCPKVLSTSTTTSTPATPTKIPATGADSAPLYILVAAVTAYLAAYVAQGRRRAYWQ